MNYQPCYEDEILGLYVLMETKQSVEVDGYYQTRGNKKIWVESYLRKERIKK
jgi:hypothetical protein